MDVEHSRSANSPIPRKSLTPVPLEIEESHPGSPTSLQRRRRNNIVVTAIRAACHHVQAQWAVLVAGQILSFLLACGGAAQATLSFDCGLSAPTLSLALFYFCLSFCLVPMCNETCARKRAIRINHDLELQYATATQQKPSNSSSTQMRSPTSESVNGATVEPTTSAVDTSCNTSPTYPFFCGLIRLSTKPSMYIGMALLDVYANYFTVLAFKYTTITSVTLLDALAIPSAMILSRVCLKREYSWVHLCGAFLCMVGVILNVFQDYEDEVKYKMKQQGNTDANEAFPHKLRGDIMAVLGGVLFGASSVVGEVAVRELGGPNEYVGMLGFFATIICTIQTLLIEKNDIADFFGREDRAEGSMHCNQSTARVLLVVFVIINVVNYLGRAWFLQVSEAAFLNLSLLTGDMWSVIFSVFAEKILPHAFFYLALAITLSGVLVYEMAPSPIQDVNDSAIAQSEESDSDESECEESNHEE